MFEGLLKDLKLTVFDNQYNRVVNCVADGVKRELAQDGVQISNIRQRVSDCGGIGGLGIGNRCGENIDSGIRLRRPDVRLDTVFGAVVLDKGLISPCISRVDPTGKSDRTLGGIARSLYIGCGQGVNNEGNRVGCTELAGLNQNLRFVWWQSGNQDSIRI